LPQQSCRWHWGRIGLKETLAAASQRDRGSGNGWDGGQGSACAERAGCGSLWSGGFRGKHGRVWQQHRNHKQQRKPDRHGFAIRWLRFAGSGLDFVSNDVWAYTINSTNGALSPVPGSPFAAGGGPYFVAVEPSGHYVYVMNSLGDDVSGYSINATSGALTPLEGSVTHSAVVEVQDPPLHLLFGNKLRVIDEGCYASCFERAGLPKCVRQRMIAPDFAGNLLQHRCRDTKGLLTG
jgi:hypothetical protein